MYIGCNRKCSLFSRDTNQQQSYLRQNRILLLLLVSFQDSVWNVISLSLNFIPMEYETLFIVYVH